MGKVRKVGLGAAAAVAFARLYFIPAKRNDLPQQVRLSPAW
jgi:magnesium-protoporphyrin IX monomethyl ester (oxidative) cyclase